MLEIITHVTRHTFMITAFVFIMMLLIEYLNVQTQGSWQVYLLKRPWTQYFLGGILGIIPGCLGAFMAVTLYSHRLFSLGALITTMIATSGDESYVMLAMIPRTYLLLTGGLLVVGIAAGMLTDLITGKKQTINQDYHELPLHAEYCECFPQQSLFQELHHITLQRFLLMAFMILALAAVSTGLVGPPEWNWVRVTLLLVSLVGLLIVSTVPEHFLEDHLWEHVAKKHLPRILAWTFSALLIMEILITKFDVQAWIHQSQALVLSMAVLIGLIPESGPHMIFVTMFAKGLIPFSILMASSIVQDGHGMLPLLAHSRKDFIKIKLVNMIVGLLVGGVSLFMVRLLHAG